MAGKKKIEEHLVCTQVESITEMKVMIEKLSHIVEGNGKEGIQVITARIEESLKGFDYKFNVINDNFDKIATNVSALVKTQIENDTEKSIEDKRVEMVIKRKNINTALLVMSITQFIVILGWIFKHFNII
jgi:hypothetical protein